MKPAIAFAAVVAVAATAYLLMRDDDDDGAEERAAEEQKRAAETKAKLDKVTPPSFKTRPTIPHTAGDVPQPIPPSEPGARVGDDHYRTRVDGDRVVRDHTGGAGNPSGKRPQFPVNRPFERTGINPKLMAKLSNTLQPKVLRCAEEYKAELPQRARVQPSITFSIVGEQFSVTGVDMASEGVPEDSGMLACVLGVAESIQFAAPGHKDIPSHTMRVPIRVGGTRR